MSKLVLKVDLEKLEITKTFQVKYISLCLRTENKGNVTKVILDYIALLFIFVFKDSGIISFC